MASEKGHHDIVRTLLENGAAVNAKDAVRNQKSNDDGDYNNSDNY